MTEYEIWAEGYAATGEHGTARLLGKAIAVDFKSACRALLADNPSYNAERNSYWCCRLFPTETEARKSFG